MNRIIIIAAGIAGAIAENREVERSEAKRSEAKRVEPFDSTPWTLVHGVAERGVA